jgi:HlyD family secretion protein
MMKLLKRILGIVAGLALLGVIGYAFIPKPIRVEVGAVARGPLRVTVAGEGKTRVKDRFVVSAPLTGRVARIELHPGDAVALGATLVRMSAIEPPLLDARARAQADAQVKVADAGREQAERRLGAAEATAAFAKTDTARIRALAEAGSLPRVELEAADLRLRTSEIDLESARFGVRAAYFQVETARAAASRSRSGADATGAEIKSPIQGRVLRVFQENAGIVAAGAPLIELGDPSALEVVVDLLSTDAVKVRPGAAMILERWGGDTPLAASVRIVEPSGFTKISALGIEEQRVNVIGDLVGPAERWSTLGDGYRADVEIVVWERSDALKLPVSALFRRADGWAVFIERGGRATVNQVEIGQRSSAEAELLAGLDAGARVLLHPSDKVREGGRIAMLEAPGASAAPQ